MVKVTSFTQLKAKQLKQKSGKKSNRSKLLIQKTSSKASQQKSDNPFDKFANSRKKHEVLNRRVKGEDRDVGRAKKKSVEDRQNRLLGQIKTAKKSNSFLDKRFGESDADLSLEDKMYLRFQKEKIRGSKNMSIYNLDSAPVETLTHKGQVLGVSNINDGDFSDDDEDERDKALGKDIVNRLHFGGGLVEKKSHEQPSTHLDALQDIISKSKALKQLKKETKEEIDVERERLDKAFRELVSESAVQYRSVKGQRGLDDDEDQEDIEVDEYDKSLNSMAFETKVRATDRTKTAEEIAVEEREKLEKLEEARLARARKPLDDEPKENPLASNGSRKRQLNDDEIDFDYKSKRASSSFPLEDDDENEESNEDHEDEGDEEEYEIDDYDGNADEDDDENEDDENASSEDADEKADEDEVDRESDDDENDNIEDDVEDENETDYAKIAKAKKELRIQQSSGLENTLDRSSKAESMPHKIPCPTTIQEFYDLIEEYTSKLSDIEILIDRILAWNSPHLPGQDGAQNRVSMHNFLDILFKYFIRVGDTLPSSQSTSSFTGDVVLSQSTVNSEEIMAHINYLTSKIFKLCQSIHDVVPALSGRWIKLFESQLQKRLRDYSLGVLQSSTCFPSVGRILLFKLFGHIFSASDFHHAIITSSILFLSQCLIQCPVASVEDLSSGLLVTSVLIDYMSAVEATSLRYIPEISVFLTSVLSLYCVPSSKLSIEKFTLKNFDTKALGNLRSVFVGSSASNSCPTKISWSWFDSKRFPNVDQTQSSAILASAYELVTKYSALLRVNESEPNKRDAVHHSFPEVFQDILHIMKSLNPQLQGATLPVALQQRHLQVLLMLTNISERVSQNRLPLRLRPHKVAVLENKAPRFDVNYKMKKDLSDDQEKNLLKQLKRQLTREKKAAVRELRRDSEFIDQVRYAEKLEKRAEQQGERWKNYAWMEQEQAVLNTHVKKFRLELKGGGSNGIKPLKHRRTPRGKNK